MSSNVSAWLRSRELAKTWMTRRKPWSKEALQDVLAATLVRSLPAAWRGDMLYRYFHYWERRGLHITANHFYSPIPDSGMLPEAIWERCSDLPGIEMNEAEQLRLLGEVFPRFREEYDRFVREPTADPYEFYFANGQFSGTDALVLHCMVRHFRPKTILEIGSGYSTRISARAAALNGDAAIVCVEPYPAETLRTMPGITELLVAPVQEVPLDRFTALGPNDILFIDSTHVSRAGSDVNYLYLEVLPRLKPGVLVHVHDIFMPQEYPRYWMMDHLLFWNEQYLLQAFLQFNSGFDVLFANNYMRLRHLAGLQSTFSLSNTWEGGSFWMRRK